MIHKPTQLFLLFIVILVLAGFTLVVRKQTLPGALPDNIVQAPASSTQTATEGIPPMVIERHYWAEANTYRGTVLASGDCQQLNADVDLENQDTERIKIKLATSATPTCLSRLSKQESEGAKKEFVLVVPSSRAALLEAVEVNGLPVAFQVSDK